MSALGGYFPRLPRVPAPRPFVAPAPHPVRPSRPHPRTKDRTGQTSPDGKCRAIRCSGRSLAHWVFLCGWCGSEFEAEFWDVMHGKQRSCGCYRRGMRPRDELGRYHG